MFSISELIQLSMVVGFSALIALIIGLEVRSRIKKA